MAINMERIKSLVLDRIKSMAPGLIRPSLSINMADLFGELMPQIYNRFSDVVNTRTVPTVADQGYYKKSKL